MTIMTSTEQTLITQYKRDGFVLGPRLLDDETVGVLRSELDRVISQKDLQVPQPLSISNLTGDSENPVWQIVNIWEASNAFKRIMEIPWLIETVAQLLGGNDIRLWHDQIQYKPSGIGGVNNWHQDWPYWAPMSCPEALTAWIALDDAEFDNGCMSMVPGSQEWGNAIRLLESIQPFDSMMNMYRGHLVNPQLCPVPLGFVHFHHCMTWHGSHANKSQRPRRAIALHFMNDRVKHVSSGNHLCSESIRSLDGETIQGPRFPLVWRNGFRINQVN